MAQTATASLHATIIIGVIAFNVVMSIIAKRKKKAQAEAKDPQAAARLKEMARQKMETERAKAQSAAAAREAAARNARQQAERRETAPEGSEERADQALEVGKDLLGQLARELGLKLPETEAPRRPVPRPTAQQTSPARGSSQKGETRPAKKSVFEAYSGERERPKSMKDLLAARKAAAAQEGENAPRRIPRAEAVPETVRPPGPMVRAQDLDAEALRRAFILKTILDKPVTLRSSRSRRG